MHVAYQLEEIKILWLVIDVVELKFTSHTAKKKKKSWHTAAERLEVTHLRLD